LEINKKKEEKIIIEQTKITKINFLGKTLDEIQIIIGEPSLNRIDENTQTVRFDTDYCRLFLYLNTKNINPRVEYFEIRDTKGSLVNNKEEIEICYKNFKIG
jgi:hypothetical protein